MKNKLIYIFFIGLLFSQCVDEIDLDIDTVARSLVVDGMITDSLQLQTIKVRRSAIIGVGNDNILEAIFGATVRVLDDEGNSFDFIENAKGDYELMMKGEVGRSYHVEVDFPDGSRAASRPATLSSSPSVDDVNFEIFDVPNFGTGGGTTIIQGIRAKVDLDVSDLEEEKFLRWRVEGEYEFREAYPMAISTKLCYIKNTLDLNQIKIFDTNALANGVLRDEPILTTEYDYRFAIQYSFNIFQFANDKEEYTYWSQVNDIINIDGNFFDPPPGSVQGNIYNPDDPKDQIFGYFSVSGVNTKRVFVNPDSLGFFVEEKCSSSPFQQQFDECRACETIINSSVERPPYWPG